MRIRINKMIIDHFDPCKDRFDNYLKHYSEFNGDIVDFLQLENITAKDKIWVSVRVLPREQLEYFAIDCAFAVAAAYAAVAVAVADAAAYAADAVAAAYAADAAAYAAADAAAYAAADAVAAAYAAADAYDAERNRQIECLIYLIETADE